MIEVLKWLSITVGIFFMSFAIKLSTNVGIFDERGFLHLIFCTILVIGGIVVYELNEIRIALTIIREQDGKL